MNKWKIPITIVLTLSLLTLSFPTVAVADTQILYAQAGVTTHTPEILTTPEKDIPKPKEKKEKKGLGWSWLLLLGAVGGVAALAGGGGGGDTDGGGGDSSNGGDGDTGDVTVSW